MSIRAISRTTGASKNTIVKLLADAGHGLLGLPGSAPSRPDPSEARPDEIWSFVGCKERNVPAELESSGIGDVWTWTAIDADTKPIASWPVGDRSGDAAKQFVCDLSSRLANRVQIATDGHKAHIEAAEAGFGNAVDYAMLVKIFGQAPEGQRCYSPPQIVGTETVCCTSRPDPKHIGTSFSPRNPARLRLSRANRRCRMMYATLKNKAAQLEAWGTEKERDELQKRSSTGVLAYRIKEAVRGSGPDHWLCASSYDSGRKAILHYQPGRGRTTEISCPV